MEMEALHITRQTPRRQEARRGFPSNDLNASRPCAEAGEGRLVPADGTPLVDLPGWRWRDLEATARPSSAVGRVVLWSGDSGPYGQGCPPNVQDPSPRSGSKSALAVPSAAVFPAPQSWGLQHMEEGDAPLAAAPPPPAPLCAAATAEILGIVRQAGPSHGFCVVSSGLRERVLAWCPEFERTPALLGVLSLLLFGRRCEEEGGVIVPWRTLLRFCGISRHAKLHEARKGVGIGTGLLLLYRDLCDPDLEWAEHDRRERKARVVTRDGIPDWLRDLGIWGVPLWISARAEMVLHNLKD